MATAQVRYTITEAARLLDRSTSTLRYWDRVEAVPQSLRAERDERGYRVYTPELIERIRRWIEEVGFYPGRGFANYHPSAEEAQAHLDSMRTAFKKRHARPRSSTPMGLQGNVLAYLGLAEGSTIEGLAGALGSSPEEIHSALTPLILKGYVEESPEGSFRPAVE